jgi:hypothetical protein
MPPGTTTETQVHARHSYMVVVVETPTDLSQKNNVRGTVGISKARVGIIVKFINVFGCLFLSSLFNDTAISIETI